MASTVPLCTTMWQLQRQHMLLLPSLQHKQPHHAGLVQLLEARMAAGGSQRSTPDCERSHVPSPTASSSTAAPGQLTSGADATCRLAAPADRDQSPLLSAFRLAFGRWEPAAWSPFLGGCWAEVPARALVLALTRTVAALPGVLDLLAGPPER